MGKKWGNGHVLCVAAIGAIGLNGALGTAGAAPGASLERQVQKIERAVHEATRVSGGTRRAQLANLTRVENAAVSALRSGDRSVLKVLAVAGATRVSIGMVAVRDHSSLNAADYRALAVSTGRVSAVEFVLICAGSAGNAAAVRTYRMELTRYARTHLVEIAARGYRAALEVDRPTPAGIRGAREACRAPARADVYKRALPTGLGGPKYTH